MKTKGYNLILMSVLFFVASIATLKAQNISPCGTDEQLQEMIKKYPDLQQQLNDYENQIHQYVLSKQGEKTLDPLLYIPVVFHIIHTNGAENIADSQVFHAIDQINEDWSKLNADTSTIVGNSPFRALASDMRVRFRLAKLDPNGNCTNGIDRIYSHLTNNANGASKLNQWPPSKYLNIWIIKSFETATQGVQPAAWSTLPGSAAWGDGVICLFSYCGKDGTSNANNASTLSHEIGHFFNLQHPWNSGGDITNASRSCGDDGVDDTPLTKGHLSCGLVDWIPHCTLKKTSQFTYNFSSVTPSSGMSDTTTTLADDTVTYGGFSAHNVSANSTDSSRFSFTNWAGGSVDGDILPNQFTGAIDTSKYYEFSFTPGFAFSTVFKTLSFNVKRNGTGVRTFSVRSSANNYLTNLPSTISPANAQLGMDTVGGGANVFYFTSDTNTNAQTGCKITFPANTSAYTNVITPLTFRFYGWNSEDTTGTFSIDDVKLVDTTGLIENLENYMDYSYCDKMFTYGQEQRVQAAAHSATGYRNNLWINSNLAATGTDLSVQPICVPKPDFYVDKQDICAGGSVIFHTNISNITNTSAYTKRWHFVGGGATGNLFVTTNITASASGAQAATQSVTYNTPGDYPVTLTVSNASGTDSTTKTSYIHVSQGWPQYNGSSHVNFESGSFWNWEINNYDGNTNGWSVYGGAGYSGSHCMAMNGYGNYHDDMDDFITPGFNLFGMTGAVFSFRSSAASTALAAADLNDVLKVYKSSDCGASWQLIPPFSFTGAALSNQGFVPTGFVPTSQSQWVLHSYTIPASMALGNVRFKFEYKTGLASNNVFIDDINIDGAVGILENSIDDANVNVYPNPTNESSTIFYHLNSKGNVKIELFDVVGKKVGEINNKNESEGDYTTTISKQENNLTNGIYFIKFSIDGRAVTRKIVFTN